MTDRQKTLKSEYNYGQKDREKEKRCRYSERNGRNRGSHLQENMRKDRLWKEKIMTKRQAFAITLCTHIWVAFLFANFLNLSETSFFMLRDIDLILHLGRYLFYVSAPVQLCYEICC
jgi:hypothetical protein